MAGFIPDGIGLLTKLTFLDLYNNRLMDTIPSSIGQLQSLQYLYLGQNMLLFDSFPQSVSTMTNLVELWVDNIPNLSGTLPLAIGGLTNLQYDGDRCCYDCQCSYHGYCACASGGVTADTAV
jgi:Leucine-rich repeat (LRR) protein